MRMYQVQLNNGNTYQVANLPSESKLKLGMRVELVGEEGIWEIQKIYGPFDSSEIKRGWNNNI